VVNKNKHTVFISYIAKILKDIDGKLILDFREFYEKIFDTTHGKGAFVKTILKPAMEIRLWSITDQFEDYLDTFLMEGLKVKPFATDILYDMEVA